MRRFTTRGVRLAAAISSLAVLAACAGPKTPIEVGVKEFPVNILLGGSDTPVPIRVLPAQNPVLSEPFFPDLSVGFASPKPTVRPPCPEFHPFDGPKIVATNRVKLEHKPVNDQTYTYRNAGTKGYPAQSSRKIADVKETTRGTDPAFTFTMTEDLAGTKKTTTLLVVPSASTDVATGIFIQSIVTQSPGKAPNNSQPRSPIKVLEFPAQPGSAWQDAATDPLTGTIITVDGGKPANAANPAGTAGYGVQTDKLKVNACGQPLDAWAAKVKIRTVTPAGDTTDDIVFGWATQFGGIPIYEAVKSYPTADPKKVTENTAIINVVPKTPAGVF